MDFKNILPCLFKPVPVFSSFSCWHSMILQSCSFAQGLMLSGPTVHPSPILPPLSSGGSFRSGSSLLPLPSSPTGCPWLQQGQLLHQSHTACNACLHITAKSTLTGFCQKKQKIWGWVSIPTWSSKSGSRFSYLCPSLEASFLEGLVARQLK